MSGPWPGLRLMAITDVAGRGEAATVAGARALFGAARPGTVMLQLRDRELPTRERLRLGALLQRSAVDEGQYFAVNDNVALALALEAHAVHLPQEGLPTLRVRALLARFASGCGVTRAVHAEARRVQEEPSDLGADLLVVSPIFAPRKGRSALGAEAGAVLGRLRATATSAGRQAACPLAGADTRETEGTGPLLFGLGGVDATNAAELLSLGADGAAVQGELYGPSPALLLVALGIAR